MPVDNTYHTNLRISLRDKNNGTYRGNLILKNWTVWYGNANGVHNVNQIASTAKPNELVDPVGASYYVIAVVLVYGMSIVALIASHIKRKHVKLIEDRQINKYLREFQTVKEKQSRESYKNLKKRIKEQINWEKPTTKAQTILHSNLSQALLPMIAFGVSVPNVHRTGSNPNMHLSNGRSGSFLNSLTSIGQPRSRTSSVGSYSSIASMPALSTVEKSPSLSRDRQERKRGLANLLSNTNHDFPLEKILEESLDSRASSFRRKSSKRSRRSAKSTCSSMGSLNQSGSGKGMLFGLTASDFANPGDNHSNDMTQASALTEIRGSTSELGSSVEPIESPSTPRPGASLGDSGMGQSSPDTENIQVLQNDSLPGVHTVVNKKPEPPNNVPKKSYLTVPNNLADEPIWLPSTHIFDEMDATLYGTYNNGFRHSPSPTKSKGSSSPKRGNSPYTISAGNSPRQGNSPYTTDGVNSPRRGNSPYTISGGSSPRRGNSPSPAAYRNNMNDTDRILCERNMSDESDSETELLQITCV